MPRYVVTRERTVREEAEVEARDLEAAYSAAYYAGSWHELSSKISYEDAEEVSE